MWRCQFSLLVCPSSYYFIYVFFLISSIVLFNMCRRSASVASSYLLTYSLHVELILLGYDGEDMIVLGTSGGGDDLVCNVVIFQSSPNLCVNSSSSYISPSMLPLSSGDLIEWSLVCHSTLSYQRFCD